MSLTAAFFLLWQVSVRDSSSPALHSIYLLSFGFFIPVSSEAIDIVFCNLCQILHSWQSFPSFTFKFSFKFFYYKLVIFAQMIIKLGFSFYYYRTEYFLFFFFGFQRITHVSFMLIKDYFLLLSISKLHDIFVFLYLVILYVTESCT